MGEKKNNNQKTKQLNLFFFYNFIYFWLCWVFIATVAFLQFQRAGATLRLRCTGFTLQASLVVEHRLSNCGTWA